MARNIDVLGPCPDSVPWWPQPKRTGGNRDITRPPLHVRLGQRIARDLVVAQFTPSDTAFDWAGRGAHRYVNRLVEAIRTHGPFVMLMDINSCYPSIDIDAVYRLDLIPPELVRSVIDHRHLSFHRVQNPDDEASALIVPIVCMANSTGPIGLLQGGSASSALLAALLHGATECVAPSIVICLGYADNFTLIGHAEEAVVEAARELARYVTESHTGRLNFRQELHDAREGFEHFGYRFEQQEDGITVTLPDAKLYRVFVRLENLIDAGSANGPGDLERLVRQVLGPFPCLTRQDREAIWEHGELHWFSRNRENEPV